MLPLTSIPDLILLVLLPLDVAPQGPRETTPAGILLLLVIVLVVLVAMVSLLFYLRRRRTKK